MPLASTHHARERTRATKTAAAAVRIFILPFVLIASRAAIAGPKPHEAVAVFDIQVQDVKGFGPEQISKFSGYLESVVVASGLSTVPRSEIHDRLAQQQRESYKVCYDETCQIELGKAVAASKVLSATWARLGRGCVFGVKLYDLMSALTEFSTTADGTCDDDGIRSAIEEIGRALKARAQEGYGKFTLDLEEGRSINNLPTDEKGWLKVFAQAKGRPSEQIQVYVNGELAGSGQPFMKQLKIGKYIVVLRTVGDRFAHERFDIELGTQGVRLPREGTISLKPVSGTLVIEGMPPQATALINGEPRAINGQLREERRYGTYEIVIEAPGYLPQSPQKVDLLPGQEISVPYHLVRNAGTISVTGTPAGAQVIIDQAPVGTIPLELHEAEVGDHVVEVQAPGHYPARKIASVKRGEGAEIQVVLKEKRARLQVEANAKVMGNPTPVEADVFLDGARIGTTPWKGEILAEVPHRLQLGLGRERTDTHQIEVPEGREQPEVVAVPATWGGAVSAVRFNLVPGPWELRSGATVLSADEPNQVRPGRVPIDLLLDGKALRHANLRLSPGEIAILKVEARPRTDSELESSMTAWRWRKWLTLVASLGSAAAGTEFMLRAHHDQTARDNALLALRTTNDPGAYDDARGQVISQESARGRDQLIGLACIGGAGALGLWSGIEWLFGEPERGDLVLTAVGEGP